MNLIDVDKLWADIEYWENHDDPKKPDYDTRDIEQVVGFQPIVEAIPIEFIRRFVMFAPPSAYTTYEYGDEFFDEEAWCNELLKDWRKENETETD